MSVFEATFIYKDVLSKKDRLILNLIKIDLKISVTKINSYPGRNCLIGQGLILE